MLRTQLHNNITLFKSDTNVKTATATASSIWPGSIPGSVIDRSLSTVFNGNGPSPDNYWQTELAEYSAVRRVVLYLRQECCKYVYHTF